METSHDSPLLPFAGTFTASFAFAIACLSGDPVVAALAFAGGLACGIEFVRSADFTLV